MRSDSWPMRLWKLVYPILIQAGISLVIINIVAAIIIFQLSSGYPEITQQQIMQMYNERIMAYNMPITLIADFMIAAILFLFYRRDSKRLVSIHKKILGVHWLLITAMGMMGCLIGNYLIALSGLPQIFEESYNQVMEFQYSASIPLEIVTLGIAAPLMEELLFRGLIFRRLRTYCKFPAAMLLSAAIFGICHGNAVQFAYAFLLGILLAFLYERFRNLFAPVVFHAAANLFSVIISEYSAVNNFLNEHTLASIVVSFTVVIAGVYFLNTTLKPKEEML